jgi:hypothetical protein
MQGTGEGHPAPGDSNMPVEQLAKLGLIRVTLHRRGAIEQTSEPKSRFDCASQDKFDHNGTPIPEKALKGRALSRKTV